VLVPASRWFQELRSLLRINFGVKMLLSEHQAASAASAYGKVVWTMIYVIYVIVVKDISTFNL